MTVITGCQTTNVNRVKFGRKLIQVVSYMVHEIVAAHNLGVLGVFMCDIGFKNV